MLQNRSEAFVFYPPKTFWDATARIESSRGTEDDAHFFIVLCSDQPVEHLQSFVYVPAAVNIVRERDQHISLLKRSLQECQEAHAHLATHLEQQNRWALDLEAKWNAARERIVQLQDAYSADVQKYEEKIAGLEEENRKKTEWALETERRLTAEIERFRAQLAETVRLLEAAESTVDERTRWALDIKGKLEHAEAQLAGAKASRWVRAGRMFGVGPEL
jgi:hypothetical protein